MITLVLCGLAGCSASSTPAPNGMGGGDAAAKGTSTNSSAAAASGTSDKQEAAGGERLIRHEAGETKISGTPSRIVVMEYGLLASVLALGEQPVGYTDDGKQGTLEELGFLKQMGDYTPAGTRQQPNLEVIRTLKPDLIIGDYARHNEIYKELSDIAPTLLLPDTKANYEDALNNHLIIGEALGKEAEAAAYVDAHQALLKQTAAMLPQDKSYLIVSLGDKVLNPRTNLFFQPSMLEKAGLKYALQASAPDETAIKASIEQLLEIDPDVLFVTNSELLEEWRKDPLFMQLKAVQEDQVFPVLHSKWSFNRSVPGANVVLEELKALAPSIKSQS
ncbi:ABC transporter substrate-binding protein [Paenibacillus sp. SYP-B4298]|uniref:ABC transporter substrate-binding protein n=1 Tax=Paenibacillus sp. SYP-B4298 TaxID=2996034 RepID=UPI0022DE3DBF|nr:ABC transporter substrate-binding protein [Paenibacillus sp. SYP-B4298]